MKEETSRQTGELALISSLFDNVRASIKSLPSRGTLEQNMIKALSDLQSTKKKIFYFFLVFKKKNIYFQHLQVEILNQSN